MTIMPAVTRTELEACGAELIWRAASFEVNCEANGAGMLPSMWLVCLRNGYLRSGTRKERMSQKCWKYLNGKEKTNMEFN